AEDYGSGFILSDNQAASGLDGFRARCAIVAHTSEHDADGHGTSVGRGGLHGDINAGQVAVDAAGRAIELNAATGCDAQMLSAWADVESAGLHRLVGLCFFDADAGELSKLSGVLRSECRGHVLHEKNCSGEVARKSGSETHHGGRAACGCAEDNNWKAVVERRGLGRAMCRC